jgi:hypothetical protein
MKSLKFNEKLKIFSRAWLSADLDQEEEKRDWTMIELQDLDLTDILSTLEVCIEMQQDRYFCKGSFFNNEIIY